MIELRKYQQYLVDRLRDSYRAGKRCPLLVLQTGGGKTVIFSHIMRSTAERGFVGVAVVHRKELIKQISLSFARFGIHHRIIGPPGLQRQMMADHFRAFGESFIDPKSSVIVASVQTLRTRLDELAALKGKMFIVTDEGHHAVSGNSWGAVMERFPSALGLIVTATPERLDGRGLGKDSGGFADDMILGPSHDWLTERGYLSPYRLFSARHAIDMSGVHKRAGEFIASEIEQQADKPVITGDAVAHYREVAYAKRTVAFCVSIEHSQHIAQAFNDAGIPAAHIDGGVDDEYRDRAIKMFASGQIWVLCNVDLIGEGFDLASIAQAEVTIDAMIDLSPTASLIKARQRWGRVLRPAPGKVAIILDHAGNIERHGLPNMEIEWSLDGKKAREAASDRANDGPTPRVCKCFAIYPSNLKACPECGEVPEIKSRKVAEVEGKLAEIDEEQMQAIAEAAQARRKQGQAKTVEALMEQGMSAGRAKHIVEARAEKQALIEQVLSDMETVCTAHAMNRHQLFGVTKGEVERMKPKALKALHETVLNYSPEIFAQQTSTAYS